MLHGTHRLQSSRIAAGDVERGGRRGGGPCPAEGFRTHSYAMVWKARLRPVMNQTWLRQVCEAGSNQRPSLPRCWNACLRPVTIDPTLLWSSRGKPLPCRALCWLRDSGFDRGSGGHGSCLRLRFVSIPSWSIAVRFADRAGSTSRSQQV